MKDSMIAGIWSNSNYDAQAEGAEAPRTGLLREIDIRFDSAIEEILTGVPADQIDKDDPFFSAMKVPEIDQLKEKKLREELGMPPE